MASGGYRPYGRRRNRSSNNDDDIENEMSRREYSERETFISGNAAEQHSQVDQNVMMQFGQMRLDDDETSTRTRQRLADLDADIAREEDSATVIRRPPPPARTSPSTREQIQEKEKKLEFIRTRKNEISQLFETLKRSQTVDLCFLLDCTGSMDPYIAEVKMKIESLVAHCQKIYADLVLKVAFVGYRDHYDDERITSLELTADIAFFKSFVSMVQACGGDDTAEDVFGGLEKAGNLQWSAPTRILFHVADAPCHGRQYHDNVLDNFPNGDPRGLEAHDLLKVLQDQNIKYWFAKLTDKTDKMISEFSRLFKIPTMLQQVKLDSAEELMSAVADSVSCSIFDMEEATIAEAYVDAISREYNTVVQRPKAAGRRSLKKFSICQNVPDWRIIEVENAYLFRNKLPGNMAIDDLKQPLPEECRKRKIRIAPKPFQEGTQRIVYYGMDCTFEPKKVVFKEFKYLGDGLNKLESYKQQMEIQSISYFLSQEFNKQKPGGAKDILFTKVIVISLCDRPKPSYFSQEPLIEGLYVKYTSNSGYVNKDEYAASLNAFSHWTYQVTNGYLMVVDLQGVKIASPAGPRFTLTDPALHCKDVTRFCSTNLGNDGMHRFFRTHHCNSICKAMSLQPHRHQPKPSTNDIFCGTVAQF